MKYIYYLISFFIFPFVLGVSSVSGATLSEWSLTGDGSPSNVLANVSAGNFTGSGVVGGVSFGSNGAYANGWPTGGKDNNAYFQITLDPNVGYKLNITDINFSERRSLTGIRDYEVEWSTDGFVSSTNVATVSVPDDSAERTGDVTGLDIDVADGDTLTIRFFGYNAESSAGTWRINDDTLKVLGSVSDAVAPTVTGIINTPTQITDTDLSLQTDITFTENMDTSVAPTVTLNGLASSPYTATGSWLNAMTYRANFTITDDNEEVVGASFTISGAQDASGNVMAVNNAHTIDVDTKAPVISEVTPVSNPTSDTTPRYTFTSDYAGTIVMTGPCDTSTAVSVAGNNTIMLDRDGSGGALLDGLYNTCQIQVRDNKSNLSAPLTISAFEVDTTAPVFASLGVSSDNAFNPQYAKSDSVLTFTVQLSLPDSFAGNGAGTGQIEFRLNGGAPQTVDLNEVASSTKQNTYTATYDLSTYPGSIPNGSEIEITGLDFQDFLGHAITGFTAGHTAAPTVIIDTVDPSLQNVSYTTTNAHPQWAKSTDVITYTLGYDEDIRFDSRTQSSVATTSSNLTSLVDFDRGIWGTSDTMTFQVVNGNNGPITLTAGNFTVTDKAGNQTTTTHTDINAALATWISGGGTAIQADTQAPSMNSVHIASNNPSDTTLAKTNDTIRVSMTTSDNLSPTVSLVGGAHILNKPLTGNSFAALGPSYIERFTDGTESSEVVVPFSFQINDQAGNVSAIKTTTDDGSGVRFDRTDPLVQAVSISAMSSDSSAYMGDVPTYYAKQGDRIYLSFQTCDWVDTPAPSGTILGNAITMTDEGLTGVGCTTPEGNPGGWRAYSATLNSADGPEGTVAFDMEVYDTAGNGVVNVTGTTDGSTVIFDKTRPTLPRSAQDTKGPSTTSLKTRSSAQFTWTGDTDPHLAGIDQISDIWKYKILYTNPFPSSVLPYASSAVSGALATVPYDKMSEIHQGSRTAPIENVLWGAGRSFDGRNTQLDPWKTENGLIPPRENGRGTAYYPYQLRMIVVDKAGNHSCDETGTHCSSQGNYDWRGEPVYEQPYGMSLKGTVRDEEGVPLPRTTVQVVSRYGEFCNDTKEVCVTTTDANGDYSLLVNSDQVYNVTFYKRNHYLEKKETDTFSDSNGIYRDTTLDGVLKALDFIRYEQTFDQTVEILLSEMFEGPDGQEHQTMLTIKSLTGEIKHSSVPGGILIESLGRIVSVESNNPSVIITDNLDNTFTIRGGGSVKTVMSGVSEGSQESFSSGELKLGVKMVPASGKAGNRRPGEKREDHLSSGHVWTEEESKADIEKQNQGVPPQVTHYTNRNGYEVFEGYQPGRIPLDRFQTKIDNPVIYRGQDRSRDLPTIDLRKKQVAMKQQYQAPQRTQKVHGVHNVYKEEVEEIITPAQKEIIQRAQKSQKARQNYQEAHLRKVAFRKTTPQDAVRGVLTKREYDKTKQKRTEIFERRPTPVLEENVSRIQRRTGNIVFRGGDGRNIPLEDIYEEPYMARRRPDPIRLIQK